MSAGRKSCERRERKRKREKDLPRRKRNRRATCELISGHSSWNPSHHKRPNHERDFDISWNFYRKAVCCYCHVVINDCEPGAWSGEFVHPTKDRYGDPYVCPNAGKTFITTDKEIEPFVRKSRRRFCKRNGIRI